LIESCLGLCFDIDKSEIVFEQPLLPSFVDELLLRNLRLNGGVVDVALHRTGGSVTVDVRSKGSKVRVVHTA
jgi:hypothetical protein